MKVGVRTHFDSMHSLRGHPKCGAPHGHTYSVEVSAEGPLRDGMVVEFDALRRIVHQAVLPLDHGNLNEMLDYPSCENLCTHLLDRLKGELPFLRLTVRIWEGEGKWAETSG